MEQPQNVTDALFISVDAGLHLARHRLWLQTMQMSVFWSLFRGIKLKFRERNQSLNVLLDSGSEE